MPLDGAYCNALLLAHSSLHQKLENVSSVQLHRSVCILRVTDYTGTLQTVSRATTVLVQASRYITMHADYSQGPQGKPNSTH